jgi:hypothetical protein
MGEWGVRTPATAHNHRETPRLLVAGGRREPGGLQNLHQVRLRHGIGFVGTAAHPSRNRIRYTHSRRPSERLTPVFQV